MQFFKTWFNLNETRPENLHVFDIPKSLVFTTIFECYYDVVMRIKRGGTHYYFEHNNSKSHILQVPCIYWTTVTLTYLEL